MVKDGFSMDVDWDADIVITNMTNHVNKVQKAVVEVHKIYAELMKEYAQLNAPWTDQTGEARRKLNADVLELAEDTVTLFLEHGVDYGVYLEVKHAGRYAIIWPTIEAHLTELIKDLQAIFN